MTFKLAALNGPTRFGMIAGIIAVGLAFASVGVLETSRLIHLIVLEHQGECDFVPCAGASTYVTAGIFAVVAIIGLGMLAAALVTIVKARSARRNPD